jgi:hypothetical protein
MRRLSAAAALIALALAVSACEDRPALIARVQDATKQICGFVPVAATVAAILDRVGSFGGSATMVATAANGICAAVTAAHAPRALYGDAGPKPTFRGVPIEGKFVKPAQ